MPSNPLPSSARSALREAVTLVTDMADAMEREAKRRGIVQSAPTSGPTVVASLRLLLSLADRGAEDTKRLDALERYARDYHQRGANGDSVVDITSPCHVDAKDCQEDCTDETRQHEWSTTGPRTAWGCLQGQGASLRAAIDDAVAKESDPQPSRTDYFLARTRFAEALASSPTGGTTE